MTSEPHHPRRRWCGPQRRIGLTGGIATGKSTVAAMLSDRHSLPVLDADVYARQFLAPDTAACQAVVDRYGQQVQTPSGALDRRALGRMIFTQPAERRWLEVLTHPLVRDAFTRDLARHHRAATVVLVAPLLFEAGLEVLCSEVWLVDLDEASQLERLLARDHLSPQEARQRIQAQWPLARKRRLADLILKNHGNLVELAGQVDVALAKQAP
ncbi:dephospho-CoA kinase [Candidatus Synechococcus spongiarum]|uniref:Dephospho-CoA kinase n=1 Tax=Candidatus Synechococcus spongiarum TaxID=431041 RepID=A0A165AFH9_9SYNE|nr:dephospho-CoA kinase [Candidatus Synechococcus spongiarum]SAY38748.1 Dephospho-CoA kinase (EC 2.7.1.24) [Candidatus Synechococcus spongiarum]